jgi:PII-like signaling protein
MQGFQVTFFTEEGRHHGHKAVDAWLMELARSLGITGVTTLVGAQGIGRDGRLHSAHFIELADRPVEVTMALSPAQCTALFDRLEAEQANLFYVRTPVEFGVVGKTGPA